MLSLLCQFNLIDSIWYSGKHPQQALVYRRKCLNLSGHKMVFVSCYHTTAVLRHLGGFPLLVLVLGETRFSPVVEDDILGTFIPCKSTRAAIKPIKSGHYRNSPCQPMECNTSRLRIRAYYVFNARTTRSDT